MDERETLAETTFAVTGFLVMLVMALLCLLQAPGAVRSLLRYVDGLDSLSREYVEVDFSAYHGLLMRREARTEQPSPLKFRFRQNFSGFDQTGLAVWQGSITLSLALLRHSLSEQCLEGLEISSLRGARIIELGTGLGALSILLAAMMQPGQIVATDGDPDAVAAAAENVLNNLGTSSQVTVQHLRWGHAGDIKSALGCTIDGRADGKFDVVLGSEITYHPARTDLLQETILELVGPSSTVILAHRNRPRSMDPKFFQDMASHFKSSACCRVEDEKSLGQGGGSVMEESSLQVHVFRHLVAGVESRRSLRRRAADKAVHHRPQAVRKTFGI
eukprot:TRINITY_DN5976_c0_g2_i1.p1 TRINITY_DN5976_c0_g2~~TRINITY_DN5976_c0_g2_i1.p1  ORF type:complete len:331 (+),score=66.48 TRINITY_DN5976_c0_g2_i1:25-1017(+)